MAPVGFSDNVKETIFAREPNPHPWERGIPYAQHYHVFSPSDRSWKDVDASSANSSASNSAAATAITEIELLSWNVDFVRPYDNERMTAAIKHIKTHVFTGAGKMEGPPKVIMFNELLVSDLMLLMEQDWVREGFVLTDISNEYWESGRYGTCMLVPKSLSIDHVCRIHYTKSPMERDALFVDIPIATGNGGKKLLRLCSTHLESLRTSPPKRPVQLAEASVYMHEPHLLGSILGGDLNSIQDFDRTLHVDNNLKDAYLETGGVEDAAEGMTWGHMAATKERERFGLCRMDKFFYCGDGVVPIKFETFGMGVEIEDKGDDRALLIEEAETEKAWATDHLGIKARFRLKV